MRIQRVVMLGYLIVRWMVLFGLVGVRRLVRATAMVVGLHPVVVVAGVVVDVWAAGRELGFYQAALVDMRVPVGVPETVVMGVAHNYSFFFGVKRCFVIWQERQTLSVSQSRHNNPAHFIGMACMGLSSLQIGHVNISIPPCFVLGRVHGPKY